MKKQSIFFLVLAICVCSLSSFTKHSDKPHQTKSVSKRAMYQVLVGATNDQEYGLYEETDTGAIFAAVPLSGTYTMYAASGNIYVNQFDGNKLWYNVEIYD